MPYSKKKISLLKDLYWLVKMNFVLIAFKSNLISYEIVP